MSWKKITIDESFTSEGSGGIVHVPENYYLMEGVSVSPSPEDRDEDKFPFLLWDMKIAKGGRGDNNEPTVGKQLKWGPCTMKEGAQFNNGNIIGKVGIKAQADTLLKKELATYKSFVALATALTGLFKGKQVVALVADGEPWVSPKTGDRYATSKIISLYPAGEYEDLASSMADAPAAAPKKAVTPAPTAPKKGAAKVEPVEAAAEEAPVEDEDIDALFAGLK